MLNNAFLPLIISSTESSELAGNEKVKITNVKKTYFKVFIVYLISMRLKNNLTEYGLISKIFHWLSAAVLFAQIPLGFYLVDLDFSEKRLFIENVHVTIGLGIFYLTILRLIYKLFNPTPALRNSVFIGQRVIAKLNHILLYLSILVITISGALKKLFNGEMLDLFFFNLEIKDNFDLAELFYEIHIYGNYTLIALILLHISAVIIHKILFQENLLKRIL